MSFQLFPPPPKKSKRQISLKRPAQPASPEPALELLQRAKAPVDFHELIIKVDDQPASPISLPPQAHVTTQQDVPTIRVPDRNTAWPLKNSKAPARAPSQRSGRATPNSNRNATRSPGGTSSVPQTPLSGDASSPISRVDGQYTASPSLSDSTTLVRSCSTVTHRTQASPREAPVMRSIFPRYNPNLPLAQQQYRPTQASPTDIPKEKISKQPYSPNLYIPHGRVSRSGSPGEPYYTPAFELGSLWEAANGKPTDTAKRTFALQMHRCSPTASASSSSSNTPVDGPSFVWGPSPIKPLYSLEQSPDTRDALNPGEAGSQELLITRHHPTNAQDAPFPVAHLDLATPPPHEPAEGPESFYLNPASALATHITTIHPKLALITALETAAKSRRASTIALADPKATSAAAADLAAEVVAESEAKNACHLFYCPVSEPLVEPYAADKTGTYELRHPQLGAFPVVVQGDVKRSLAGFEKPSDGGSRSGSPAGARGGVRATITLLNPFAAPRTADHADDPKAPPKQHSAKASTSTTSKPKPQSQRPPTPTPDEVLARLDLSTHALTLDAAAMSALGNVFLIDVAVATILAVCVAESKRDGSAFPPPLPILHGAGAGGSPGGQTWSAAEKSQAPLPVFAGPPTATARGSPKQQRAGKSKSKSKSKSENKAKGKAKQPDLEAGERQQGVDGEELPWVTEAILGVLGFAFKTVVLVLSVAVKALAKVVVGLSRCAAKA